MRGHVRFKVSEWPGIDGWVVYGVRADGWHDRLGARPTFDEAVAVKQELEAALEREGETPSRGQA